MRIKTAVTAGLMLFLVACGWVIVDAVRVHKHDAGGQLVPLAAVESNAEQSPQEPQKEATAGETQGQRSAGDPDQAEVQTPVKYPVLNANNSPAETVVLGELYEPIKRTSEPDKYKFRIELTSRGAAVSTVTLSEFKSRDPENPLPLTLLAPLGDQRKIYTLASTSLRVAPAEAAEFSTKSFPLDKLDWKLAGPATEDTARFEAFLYEEGQDPSKGEGTLRIVKTYRIEPGSYEMMTDVAVENLSGRPLKVQMEIQGPTGISREDVRQDARKVMAAYKNTEVTTQLMPFGSVQAAEREKVYPSQGIGTAIRNLFGKTESPEKQLELLPKKQAPFIWAALTNKYFAAITRPVTQTPEQNVVEFGSAHYYGPLDDREAMKEAVGDVSYVLKTDAIALAAAGQEGALRQFGIGTYLGPKDRDVFEHNEVYRTLGYFHTIDFRACCCPASMIAPLAFGIIWLMKSMYTLMGPWGNYGVVIMVLVFIVRLILHPITKKSQVSMMKMQKLGPRMQEIQKKYANNRAEMNKQVMQLYKEGGATPVMGMLPMILQMPIWIALWTAVYTSIDLRGAGFLPFWITDLSAPDHLFRIPFAAALQQIPLVGAIVPEYFNLLPILMGVVMYLQQKLMPTPQAAATNPQMAQQQKMMMWMMPLLFPVMLYNGPSGVNLYIMSSIGAGVIEQKVIRKHIQQRQEEEEQGKVPTTAKLGGKVKKKKPKPFFRMK